MLNLLFKCHLFLINISTLSFYESEHRFTRSVIVYFSEKSATAQSQFLISLMDSAISTVYIISEEEEDVNTNELCTFMTEKWSNDVVANIGNDL